jgi:hypothetical protein
VQLVVALADELSTPARIQTTQGCGQGLVPGLSRWVAVSMPPFVSTALPIRRGPVIWDTQHGLAASPTPCSPAELLLHVSQLLA